MASSIGGVVGSIASSVRTGASNATGVAKDIGIGRAHAVVDGKRVPLRNGQPSRHDRVETPREKQR